MRSLAAVVASISTLVALLAIAPAASALPTGSNSARDRLDVYAGDVTSAQMAKIVALGIDRHELGVSSVKGGAKGTVHVSAILSGGQVEALRARGVDLSAKTVNGLTASQDATTQAADGYNVFKKYSGPGGIQEEFTQTAAAKPAITKLISIGKTLNNQDIIAMKVSTGARQLPDGSKPSVLYIGAQHAREWITPEMIRRLMHYFVDGYATDASIRNLLTQNELWFVPNSNPDGYDFTFEPGQRLWRKNLRDNNGDGQITGVDGVDLNRNFPYKWGYDNEGSSDDPTSETYRGTSPGSEPETKAMDAFVKRVKFKFMVNYHSAAELLLYGVGWQVATPTPDDVIAEAMAGDDANPAVPGYDPDISAELYTTNGETDGHVTNLYGTFAFTPETSTCQDASDSNPDDDFEADDCDSVFNFPDDEALIEAEFEKNIPFALSVAKSAKDPSNPVSAVGRTAEDFRVDTFDVSYGDPQTVAVTAKRSLALEKMQYRINGGAQKSSFPTEWNGGERYGEEGDIYYHELRGVVTGAKTGDHVEVWFTALKGGLAGGLVSSQHFTYTVQSNTGAKVLVIADEDYTGVNPDYPPGTNAPKYAAQYRAALTAAGYISDLWDVDKQGVPHDLGVLSHYKAVVWYYGDNRITQDPEDEDTETFIGELPDISVAEKEQYLTMAVRDYLNAGGKLVRAGETAGYEGLPGISDAVGGLFYGLNGDPSAQCVVTTDFFSDCLILANDFRQYYEGAFTRIDKTDPPGVKGIAAPINGFVGVIGGPVADGDNPLDEAGQFQATSEVLPVSQFPQFASQGAVDYQPTSTSPYAPIQGTKMAAALHADKSYMRLSKTVNLTGASSGQLRFQLATDVEEGYDHVIVEAHTVGQNDWTTLPEVGGATSTDPPAQCDEGFLLALHPFLTHYLGGPDCTDPGTTGTWNSITGTHPWQQVAYDLAPFLGKRVELSITYVSDQFTGGKGAFVDDTRIVVNGVTTSADGFEGATTTWTIGGPPAGSPANARNWRIGTADLLNDHAGTSTKDTLLLGFGLEHLSTNTERTTLIKKAIDGLIANG